jgi:hypothetical protein
MGLGELVKRAAVATSFGGKARILLDSNTTNTTESAWDADTAFPSSVTGGDGFKVQDPGFLYLQMFGEGSDGNEPQVIITGFKKIDSGKVSAGSQLASVTGTLGANPTGTSGVTPNGTDDHFADAMSADSTYDGLTVYSDNTTDKTAAHARVDCRTFDYVTVQVLKGTATNANVVYWWGN